MLDAQSLAPEPSNNWADCVVLDGILGVVAEDTLSAALLAPSPCSPAVPERTKGRRPYTRGDPTRQPAQTAQTAHGVPAVQDAEIRKLLTDSML